MISNFDVRFRAKSNHEPIRLCTVALPFATDNRPIIWHQGFINAAYLVLHKTRAQSVIASYIHVGLTLNSDVLITIFKRAMNVHISLNKTRGDFIVLQR